MGLPTSVRFADQLRAALEDHARRSGRTVSDLVQQYVREGVVMEDHPGIVFRSGPAGRRAGLVGGPDVAEVIDAVKAVAASGDQAVAEAAADVGIPEAMVRDAVGYYAAFPDEVDAELARRARALRRAAEQQQRARELLG